MSNNTGSHRRRYPEELRDRAIRKYFEAVDHIGERHGAVGRVADQLGDRTGVATPLGAPRSGQRLGRDGQRPLQD
jgi:transposase-like protein